MILQESIDLGAWYQVLRRDPCPYCGVRMTWCRYDRRQKGTDASRDHIVPRSLGGTTTYDNIAMVCCSCNSHKSNYKLLQFLVKGGLRRREELSYCEESPSRAEILAHQCRELYGPDILTPGCKKPHWKQIRSMLMWIAQRAGISPKDMSHAVRHRYSKSDVETMALSWERRSRSIEGKKLLSNFLEGCSHISWL